MLAGFYGVKRVLDRERPGAGRRPGLRLINLAVILVRDSMYFSRVAK